MIHKPFLLIALGVLIAMLLETTIASFANPVLASVKLSYS